MGCGGFVGRLMSRRHSFSSVRLACVALVSLGFAACARETTPVSAAVAVWAVDSLPTLTLGLADSGDVDASFERITGATRLPDGTVLVADLGEAPLKLFGADGQFLRRLARKGGGPGEMEYLARLYRCGDVFFTYDIDGYRISEYSLDGTLRRSFRFQVPEGQQVPYVSACNSDGRFAHLGWGAPPKTAGYHRDTVPLWYTPTPDGPPTVIDSAPASERWGQTHDGSLVGSMLLPLGKQPSIAFGPAGFYISTGDSVALRVYAPDGTSRGVYRLDDSLATVTPADIRDFIEAEISEDGERRRASIEREYAAITFPSRHGAITALIVDREGMLWLRAHAAPAAATVRWRVLTPEGNEAARVDLPRRMEVFEIGRDYLLGREIDADEGVPVLRMLGLRRQP